MGDLMKMYVPLELFEGSFDPRTSQEIFEELAPYLEGRGRLELTTKTVEMTNIAGTGFCFVPAEQVQHLFKPADAPPRRTPRRPRKGTPKVPAWLVQH